jgi:hypothetical protein
LKCRQGEHGRILRGEEVSIKKLLPTETDDSLSKVVSEIARRAMANLEEKELQTLFVAVGQAASKFGASERAQGNEPKTF